MAQAVQRNDAVTTAGVYVRFGDRFVFMFGPSDAHDSYGVVRLGGHREGQETALACALREAREEAGIEVALSQPKTTYYMQSGDSVPFVAATGEAGRYRPLLLSGGSPTTPHSATFMGTTASVPRPCGETQGIILLTGAEIHLVCAGTVELGENIAAGARAIERLDMKHHERLVPHLQLKFLDWALKEGVFGDLETPELAGEWR